MKLFGLRIPFTKTAVTPLSPTDLTVPGPSSGWFPRISEPFAGAWQRNLEQRTETVLTYHAVYSCVTLISAHIAKCRPRLVEQGSSDVWTETSSPAFSPVLAEPNGFQTRIQFYKQWMFSKLIHGNTYVLLERDERRVVVAMYILDALRCKPLVAPDGSIYYRLSKDNLAGVEEDNLVIPASEIIHDVMDAPYHPLCGLSPLTASALPAALGLSIQRNSSAFFANGSQPSGILTAPGNIAEADAARLKAYWEEKFTGGNAGKVAVVGSDLKYAPMTINALNSQLIEQQIYSAKTVCSTFHVPAYKAGVADPPAYNNIEALEQGFYSQCLQRHFEEIEILLDRGLGLNKKIGGKTYGVEFDLDDLLRMDTATMADTLTKLSGAGLIKLDEARKRLGYIPMVGGDDAYMQQQNFSVRALAKRDAKDNPFAAASAPAAASSSTATANDNEPSDDEIVAAGVVAAWKLKNLLAAA